MALDANDGLVEKLFAAELISVMVLPSLSSGATLEDDESVAWESRGGKAWPSPTVWLPSEALKFMLWYIIV